MHLQKNRLRPSAALFKLAQANLEKYPARHERLDLKGVLALVAGWILYLAQLALLTGGRWVLTVPKYESAAVPDGSGT